MARQCENCGYRLPMFVPRKRGEDGTLLCPGCHPEGRGSEGRPIGVHGGYASSGRPVASLAPPPSGPAPGIGHTSASDLPPCPTCGGSGAQERPFPGATCPTCHGSGVDTSSLRDERQRMKREEREGGLRIREAVESGLACEACSAPIGENGLIVEAGRFVCPEGCKTASTDGEFISWLEANGMTQAARLWGDDEDAFWAAVPDDKVAEVQEALIHRDKGLYGLGSRKVAHDSGDGATIFHCFACGSGQVTGRSDGTAECDFCGVCFTVQVQPEMSAMPQTVNGQPSPIPGMPGDHTQPAQEAPGAVPEVPAAGPAFVPPDKGNAFVPPAAPAMPVAAAFYLTADKVALPTESYLRHLAIKHADDREAVIAQVKAER